jgi:hemolysin activation/secretion protein
MQAVVGSSESTGRWISVNHQPLLPSTFEFFTNWLTTIPGGRPVGASEPLLSNEQFGAGGVNSVRGYQEGEVFGDDGWHVVGGTVAAPYLRHDSRPDSADHPGHHLYRLRPSYLLDPQGRNANHADLWGTGFGCVSSIGSSWETRFLFSVPLISTTTTSAYRPFFSFSLTAQF